MKALSVTLRRAKLGAASERRTNEDAHRAWRSAPINLPIGESVGGCADPIRLLWMHFECIFLALTRHDVFVPFSRRVVMTMVRPSQTDRILHDKKRWPEQLIKYTFAARFQCAGDTMRCSTLYNVVWHFGQINAAEMQFSIRYGRVSHSERMCNCRRDIAQCQWT